MTVRGLVSLLRDEITQRETLIATLEERLDTAPPPKPAAPRGESVGSAVIAVLREVGRPMHGLGEIIPALEARGVMIKNKAGFATALLRTRKIVRTAPGTFALASDVVPA